ncbi:MAG: glycosyltransferase family 2 protein [Flavobacterium sp.]
MDKKVFVIIVTYNGAKWIDRCIRSLRSSSYPVSIIVIDNASTDNTLQLLGQYPEIDVITSRENLGFGRANNISIKKALDQGAGFLFLLNQDTWVFDDTIGNLIEKMEEFPHLGILSPVHLASDENTQDASFATYFSRKEKHLDSELSTVPFVNAAAWMLSRDCIEKVGLFEPAFSHYGEDRNYCDRVLYKDFEIGIATNSKIVHDRVIKRNYNKDTIQSRYKILATLLNINYSMPSAYFKALREVFGLPKYFRKHYGLKALSLFVNLAGYYISVLLSSGKIKSIRNSHK